MTVNEFFNDYCQSTLKVFSGYNGKLLCKAFNPKKTHQDRRKRSINDMGRNRNQTEKWLYAIRNSNCVRLC